MGKASTSNAKIEKDFRDYNDSHNILDLIAELIQQCFLQKADNPKEFIVNYLTKSIEKEKPRRLKVEKRQETDSNIGEKQHFVSKNGVKLELFEISLFDNIFLDDKTIKYEPPDDKTAIMKVEPTRYNLRTRKRRENLVEKSGIVSPKKAVKLEVNLNDFRLQSSNESLKIKKTEQLPRLRPRKIKR